MDDVKNDESLYRRLRHPSNIPLGLPEEYRVVNGNVEVSSSAFADRNRQPSVDRARLCPGPEWTQRGDDLSDTSDYTKNCVIGLNTQDVREINYSHIQGGPGEINVIPKPVKNIAGYRDNFAHAEIRVNPPHNQSTFKRFRVALATLANTRGIWQISPTDD